LQWASGFPERRHHQTGTFITVRMPNRLTGFEVESQHAVSKNPSGDAVIVWRDYLARSGKPESKRGDK